MTKRCFGAFCLDIDEIAAVRFCEDCEKKYATVWLRVSGKQIILGEEAAVELSDYMDDFIEVQKGPG